MANAESEYLTTHGSVSGWYEKIKSMMDICWGIQFYCRLSIKGNSS